MVRYARGMRLSRVRLGIVLVASAVAISAGMPACRSPTQIVFELSTDGPCYTLSVPVERRQTAITLGRRSKIETATKSTAKTEQCDSASGRIGSIVAVPSGDNDEEIGARIVSALGKSPADCAAGGDGQCIVARRAVRFIPNRSLTIPIFLSQGCAGVVCDPDSTCEKGICVPLGCAGKGTCGGDAGIGDASTEDDAASGTDGSHVDAPSDAQLDACVPDCAGRQCGSDGCGGSCGPSGGGCPGANDVCKSGVCVCQPTCVGKQCGDNGCGSACGSCGSNQTCSAGTCVGILGTCATCTNSSECGGGLSCLAHWSDHGSVLLKRYCAASLQSPSRTCIAPRTIRYIVCGGTYDVDCNSECVKSGYSGAIGCFTDGTCGCA